MAAILRLRGPAQFEREIGSHMFRLIQPQLLVKDVSFGSSYAIPSSDTPSSAWHQKVGQDLTVYGNKLVSFVQSFRRALSRDPSDIRYQQELQHVVDCASAFSDAFESIDTSKLDPVGDAVETVLLNEGGITFSLMVPTTASLFQAMKSAMYWTMRLRVYRLMLDSISELKAAGHSTQSTVDEENVQRQLYECAKNLAGVIPCLMSDTRLGDGILEPSPAQGCFQGALIAMNVINTLCSTQELDAFDPGFRLWTFRCLLRLNNEFGIKQARAFYNLYGSNMVKAHSNLRTLLIKLDLMEGSAKRS